MSEFAGFPADALTFFDEIVANNDKTWFEANKTRFKTQVQQPAQQFVLALGERLQSLPADIRYDTRLSGSGSIMRIYRDTRFSADKTPYKTNLGIVWWEGAGKKMEEPSFYFHLAADGNWMGGGMYQFNDLDQYRRAVDHAVLGPELERVAAELDGIGMPLRGERYKRVPRGYPQDHPRADLLKFKGLTVITPPIERAMMTSPALVDHCFAQCRKMLPLHRWLVQMRQA